MIPRSGRGGPRSTRTRSRLGSSRSTGTNAGLLPAHVHTLRNAGIYPAARMLAQTAVDQWRHTLGEDHPARISAMAYLAATLWSVGEHGAAREMHREIQHHVVASRRWVLQDPLEAWND